MPPSTAPGMLPMPPTTAATKCLEPRHETHQGIYIVEHAHQHSGDSREKSSQGEGPGDDLVRIDPHQPRRLDVLRRGPHGLAKAGLHHQQIKNRHRHSRNEKNDKFSISDFKTEGVAVCAVPIEKDFPCRTRCGGSCEIARIGGEGEPRGVLEKE